MGVNRGKMVQIGKINRLSIKEIQPGAIQLDGGGLGNIFLKGRTKLTSLFT